MYSTISHRYETLLGYFSSYSQLTFEPLCGYFHYDLKRYSVLSTFDSSADVFKVSSMQTRNKAGTKQTSHRVALYTWVGKHP